MSDGFIEFRTTKGGRPAGVAEGEVKTLAEAKRFAAAVLVACRCDEVRWYWGEHEWRAFPGRRGAAGYQYKERGVMRRWLGNDR